MRGIIILCFITLAVAAPQGYVPVTIPGPGIVQPHLQYGPVAMGINTSSAITSSFLRDLQTVMNVMQTTRTESTQQAPTIMNGDEQISKTNPITTAGSSTTIPTAVQPQARYLSPSLPSLFSNSVSAPSTNADPSFASKDEFPVAEPVITKRFFLHTAPEEEDDEIMEKILTVGKPRKNYNVVFIKSPNKISQKTSLKIATAPNEDKTVIYVLTKKQEAAEIDAQVQEQETSTAKPEVYFIKYKTNEEAEHAQQTIQASYDNLGGSTEVSNEGVAPETSVIGALDSLKSADSNDLNDSVTQVEQEVEFIAQAPSNQQQPVETQTNNGYLPPARYYY